MREEDRNFYVKAALSLQGYHYEEETITRINVQFTYIEKMAQSFLHIELPHDAEPAPVFRP